jgi:glycosyltransferase involved in cell wall biosynthesis
LYAGAKALLYPVEDEDFGMVPIESMMAGTPVIAHRSGGPSYTVKREINGILFDQLDLQGLEQAVKEFKKMSFDSEKIAAATHVYTKKEFEKRIKDFTEISTN